MHCPRLMPFALSCQATLAQQLGLALNVHSRGAGHHAISLLQELGVGDRCLMHAFDGKAKYACNAVRRVAVVAVAWCHLAVVGRPWFQVLSTPFRGSFPCDAKDGKFDLVAGHGCRLGLRK